MKPKPFIATAVQHPPIFLDLGKSIEKACDLITAAAAEGAKLIVFPETWLTGYPVWFDLAPGAALWGSEAAEAVYQRLLPTAPAWTIPQSKSCARRQNRLARSSSWACTNVTAAPFTTPLFISARRAVILGLSPETGPHLYRTPDLGARGWLHPAGLRNRPRAAGRVDLLGTLDAPGTLRVP